MTPGAVLLEPGITLRAAVTEEARLRDRYLELAQQEPTLERTQSEAQMLLRASARVLEVLVVGAALVEELEELGTPSIGASGKGIDYFRDKVLERSGLDVVKVIQEARRHFHLQSPPPAPSKQLSRSLVTRALRAAVEFCPIDYLEEMAAQLKREVDGHRCRVAYDAIKAFLLRSDPRERERWQLLGTRYVRGEISVDEIGTIVGLPAWDVVASLERLGYARPVERIRLGDEERAARLLRIRKERLSRSGSQPILDSARVARAVIASERIEAVDARAWLAREALG